MVFRVKADIKATQRLYRQLEKKAVKKAARNALRDTTYDVSEFVGGTLWNRSFPNRRNMNFGRFYFKVIQKPRTGSLRGVVGPNPKIGTRGWVEPQIRGGAKRARSGRLAIPTSKVARGAKGVYKRDRPGNPKHFVDDFKGKGPAIWRMRDGRRELLFVLKPSASVDKAFPYYRLGLAMARRQWPKHFEREIRREIAKYDRNR